MENVVAAYDVIWVNVYPVPHKSLVLSLPKKQSFQMSPLALKTALSLFWSRMSLSKETCSKEERGVMMVVWGSCQVRAHKTWGPL